MDERPVDDRGILFRGGNVVEAAEEKHRGSEHAEDGENTDKCQQRLHGRSPVVAGNRNAAGAKRNARNRLCAKPDIGRNRVGREPYRRGCARIDTPFVSRAAIR